MEQHRVTQFTVTETFRSADVQARREMIALIVDTYLEIKVCT